MFSPAGRQNAGSIAQVRAQIEQEVLGELSDHPTVGFIKRLEDERAHYKEQLAEVDIYICMIQYNIVYYTRRGAGACG